MYNIVINILYYVLKLICFVFVWCPCMAINAAKCYSITTNGGFLPGIILLTQCYYHRGTNPFKYHEEDLYLQPMTPPNNKCFDIFPLTGGCSEGLDAFKFFFKHNIFPLIEGGRRMLRRSRCVQIFL